MAYPQDASRHPFHKDPENAQTRESLSIAIVDAETVPRPPSDTARTKYEEHLQRARLAGTVLDARSELASLRDALRVDLATFESLALVVKDEARQVQIQVRIDAIWEILGSRRLRPIPAVYPKHVPHLSAPQPNRLAGAAQGATYETRGGTPSL